MTPATLASADPAVRATALDAAKAIDALRAEQDQPRPLPVFVARLRGEAARAMVALYEALPVDANADGPETRAHQQAVLLHNLDTIPSATLRTWAAAWRATAGAAS